MADDRTPATARANRPFDPTGMFMPGAIPVTAADFWQRRIAINLAFLWLAFPLLDLVASDPHPLRAGAVGVAVLGFVAAYNCLPRERPPHARTRTAAPLLGVLALITTALTLADRPGWSLLFVFTAISGAMRLPSRAAVLWIGFCAVLTAATNLIAGSDAVSTISLTATTAVIGVMMFAFRRLMELNRALLSAREEVARLAVSEERLRFGRDLHDLLGHGLTVIAVKAELAEQLLARDAPGAAEHVTDIKTVARNALSEVREAVSGYRRPTLVSELSGARIALQAAGIQARLDATDAPLDPEVEAVLAWAVREGTTNVIRHSGARSCRIAVQPGPLTATAEIVDDGHAVAPNGTGSGLAGLRERAEHMAGCVEAGPAPGGGFRLFVTVPVRGRAT